MGHVWQYTRNVVAPDGLVHRARRDIKPGAARGRVVLDCTMGERVARGLYTRAGAPAHIAATYTQRALTCLACLGV